MPTARSPWAHPARPARPDWQQGAVLCDNGPDPRPTWRGSRVEEDTMGKTGRKRRARKKKGANHGKRPNA
ncbi:hypothetical protein GCM10027273_01480 [Nocardioides pakistanensis]